VPDDEVIDVEGRIAVIGMGGVGSGAYDSMAARFPDEIIGIDLDPRVVVSQEKSGRRILLGDPSDADFWERMQATHELDLVMITLPRANTTIAVIEQLRAAGFAGRIAATARYRDQEQRMVAAGADTVFNTFEEAGAGFAAHALAAGEGSP